MANPRPHFSEALKGFFLSKQADGRSPCTIDGYRWTLTMLCDYLRDPVVEDMRIDHLRSFFAYLQTEYRPKRIERLSNHSLNSFWIGIKAFFSWAELEYDLKERPDKHLQRPRYELKEVMPFNEKEIRALLKACERTAVSKTKDGRSFTTTRPTATRDVALILLMLDTGLRVGEVARLRIADVNLDSGEIYVAAQGAGIKSRSRHVYLGSAGRKALWRYLSKRENAHAIDPLFMTTDNHPMNRSSIRHLTVGIGKRAGILHAHPHRFRHTFAVEFLRNGVRSDFEQSLAHAHERGHLVILADGGDELLEPDVASVTARLQVFERLVVVERTARLPLERHLAVQLNMPHLTTESLVALAGAGDKPTTPRELIIAELQHEDLAHNLELLLASELTNHDPRAHLAPRLAEWVAFRLQRSRPSDGIVEEQRKAEHLLYQLAFLRLDSIDEADAHRRFTREQIRLAFRKMFGGHPPPEDQLWLLVERCERAGLLERHPAHWDLHYPTLLKLFCAEQLIEYEQYWVGWGLRDQQLLQWTAALIAHRSQAHHIQHFFERLLMTLHDWSDLSWLELADVLAIFHGDSGSVVSDVRAKVQDRLKVLAQYDSNDLRQAAQGRAQRLGLDASLPEVLSGSAESFLLPDLDSYAQDLLGLLNWLKIARPQGSEAKWIEDQRVQSGLVRALCAADQSEVKWRCAAWLRRSSLSGTLQTDILPPRRVFTWEVLARIACDRQRDTLTRMTAMSVLAMACNFYDIALEVYMVKVSYFQKPYRRIIMENFGATVFASPSNNKNYGRDILAEDPDSPGSLGMAISEAVEAASSSGGAKKYSLYCCIYGCFCEWLVTCWLGRPGGCGAAR